MYEPIGCRYYLWFPNLFTEQFKFFKCLGNGGHDIISKQLCK